MLTCHSDADCVHLHIRAGLATTSADLLSTIIVIAIY